MKTPQYKLITSYAKTHTGADKLFDAVKELGERKCKANDHYRRYRETMELLFSCKTLGGE